MIFRKTSFRYLDWTAFLTYLFLVFIGFLAIYSIGYNNAIEHNLFWGLSLRSIKQLTWFLISASSLVFIFNINTSIYQTLGFIFYIFIILVLLGTKFLGVSYGGHSSWYKFKSINFQPSEFAKFACALTLSKFFDERNISLSKFISLLKFLIIIGIPALMILLQGDLGSAVVFSSFLIVAYREGMSSKILIYGFIVSVIILFSLIFSKIYLIISIITIGMIYMGIYTRKVSKIIKTISQLIMLVILIFSIDLIMHKVLKTHQQNRIKALINPSFDPRGISWNIIQSKIAIGSGGLFGKGFLKGSQTQLGFVPAQETDFVFSNIGEEYGLLGSILVIILFVIFLNRIINIAERQNSRFERIYGYCVFSIIAFHFIINIAMTIGLAPVIGIPLPFITYGGSSLFSFSIMVFILLKMDADRIDYLSTKQQMIKIY
ncbi:MAG: rod shape-determining protein RodA [Bacteroidetes bacterium]|nr:rod shape-determining protein RodA [Bacteroidota bacterium]